MSQSTQGALVYPMSNNVPLNVSRVCIELVTYALIPIVGNVERVLGLLIDLKQLNHQTLIYQLGFHLFIPRQSKKYMQGNYHKLILVHILKLPNAFPRGMNQFYQENNN